MKAKNSKVTKEFEINQIDIEEVLVTIKNALYEKPKGLLNIDVTIQRSPKIFGEEKPPKGKLVIYQEIYSY